jgi:hypothetical protein
LIAALVGGWLVALASAGLALSMRARLARAADAEHELRGALTAFGLGLERLARTPAGRRQALSLQAELERARTALADLSPTAVRARPATIEAAGRVAQVVGNLMSNAVEHGEGPVRVEVTNAARPAPAGARAPGRGRGLRIAERAARAAGGQLTVSSTGGRFSAAVELPVER